MSALSNFGPPHDGRSPDGSPSSSPGASSAVRCGIVQPAQIDAALRLLLAGPDGYASDEQVDGFVEVAQSRGLDLNGMWVAIDGTRLAWSLLPVVSPGRTMLILSPPRLAAVNSPTAIPMLVEAVCSNFGKQGIDLAQMLIDPAEAMLRRAYVHQRFDELAELIYLQRSGRRVLAAPPLAATMRILNYSPATHALFAQTIAKTYEQSLDCPALNGLRDMEDIIAGHKASGEFDPNLWFVLTEAAAPCGVLLLSRTSHNDGMELVYLGLTPASRGRRIGDALMNLAMITVARQSRSELTLAVDSKNAPALKLYHRHGLRRVGSRMAMIRDLRKTL